MSTTYTTTPTPQTRATPSPCRCHESAPTPCTCCNLVCFDRPNYFCGHLLTDADLSLEQKYVIEKNKLYHRALDGYGIACGLKLTCDSQCKGYIRIHEGFAIDDCGNDLVVCEDTRFNVIGALNSKHLLVSSQTDELCEPKDKDEEPPCPIKQCFYVTICYGEEESDYETPFQSSCTSGPKECLPTRTKERVRFDVTDKLPPQHSYLENLKKRFRSCFEIYCEGPIGKIMKTHLRELQEIVGAKLYARHLTKVDITKGSSAQASEAFRKEWKEAWKDPCELFCTLRAYFLNQLRNKPDEFNCNLYDEVACLACPELSKEGWGETEQKDYWTGMQDAFKALLTYMQHYQFDCALGELIFCCEQPCESHCLVLGTVEVVDGKLTRVCNTPRKYLWAPANFVQVLLFTLLTGYLNSETSDKKDNQECVNCCPDYPNFDPEELLQEFHLSECGRYHAATAGIYAVDAVRKTLHQRFDPFDTRAKSPVLFEKVQKTGEYAGINVQVAEEKSSALGVLNMMQALVGSGLVRPEETVAVYHAAVEGEAARVIPDFVADISPDYSLGRGIERHLETIKKVVDVSDRFDALSKRMDDLEATFKATSENQVKKSPKKPKEEKPE